MFRRGTRRPCASFERWAVFSDCSHLKGNVTGRQRPVVALGATMKYDRFHPPCHFLAGYAC